MALCKIRYPFSLGRPTCGLLLLLSTSPEFVSADVLNATNPETGLASWYGPGFDGRATASGEIYDMEKFTAAHRTLPLGTYVKVKRTDGKGESVVVKVNDRGPFIEGRIIDLSAGAAKKLGFYKKGTVRVLVQTIELEG